MKRERWNAVWVECAVLAFFLALGVLATRPLVLRLDDRTIAGGDPLGHLWTVRWLTTHFFEPRQIFQGNVFHPAPYAVVLSDLSLGTVVLALPFRSLAGDAVPLFNVALLLALTFGGWAFHRLVRELTGNLGAGVLAGVLAAFASHQMTHLPHLNLLSTGWLALFLLGLHRVLRRPSVGHAVLTGVGLALTVQSSGYYAVIAVLLAVVFAASHSRALQDRRVMGALAGAAALAIALTAPYLHAYFAARAEEGLHRSVGMSVHMSFRPRRDLGSYSYLYGSVLGRRGECLFPGVLTLGLLALGRWRTNEHARFYAWAAAVLLVFSLGPQMTLGGLSIPLPYRWLREVPALDAMRHPYTFAAVASFLLSILAGLGWAALPLASRPWAGVAAVLVAVAETIGPAPELQDVPRGIPPAYRLVQGLAPGAVLELPVFEEQTCVWAARHGLPVLNGLGSAFVPSRTLRLDRYVTNQWIRSVPADVDDTKATRLLLEAFDARYVIVPVGRKPEFAPLAAAFDRSRTFAFTAAAEDGDRVYEVRRSEALVPAPNPTKPPPSPEPRSED